jgi:hypothetical protein
VICPVHRSHYAREGLPETAETCIVVLITAQAPPWTVPPFQVVSASYRMRHLHASASSQETGHAPDPR